MRILIGLLLTIALSLGAPSPCAHALGIHATGLQPAPASSPKDADPARHSGHSAGHDHSHHAHPIHHPHSMPDQDEPDPCADDCDGGLDCPGCGMLSPAIVANHALGVMAQPGLKTAWMGTSAGQAAPLIEPPPPKRRS